MGVVLEYFFFLFLAIPLQTFSASFSTCSQQNPPDHFMWTGMTNNSLFPADDRPDQYFEGPPFQRITDSQLLKKLEKHWPNLRGSAEDHQKLWEEAWNRYGRCTQLEQDEYFRRSIDMGSQLNLEKVMKDARIVRGGTYSTAYVRSTIKKASKYDVVLFCEKAANGLIYAPSARWSYMTVTRTVTILPKLAGEIFIYLKIMV